MDAPHALGLGYKWRAIVTSDRVSKNGNASLWQQAEASVKLGKGCRTNLPGQDHPGRWAVSQKTPSKMWRLIQEEVGWEGNNGGGGGVIMLVHNKANFEISAVSLRRSPSNAGLSLRPENEQLMLAFNAPFRLSQSTSVQAQVTVVQENSSECDLFWAKVIEANKDVVRHWLQQMYSDQVDSKQYGDLALECATLRAHVCYDKKEDPVIYTEFPKKLLIIHRR